MQPGKQVGLFRQLANATHACQHIPGATAGSAATAKFSFRPLRLGGNTQPSGNVCPPSALACWLAAAAAAGAGPCAAAGAAGTAMLCATSRRPGRTTDGAWRLLRDPGLQLAGGPAAASASRCILRSRSSAAAGGEPGNSSQPASGALGNSPSSSAAGPAAAASAIGKARGGQAGGATGAAAASVPPLPVPCAGLGGVGASPSTPREF